MFLEGKAIAPGTGHAEGRALLQDMYLRHVGQPVPEIAVTDLGKPYFVDSPWHFSISHTKRHVFCALSQYNIGMDAEEQDRAIRPELAKQILSDREHARYAQAQDQRLALLSFWVLKEALGKLSGEGIKFHPTHTDFSPDDLRVHRIYDCLVAVIEEENNAV